MQFGVFDVVNVEKGVRGPGKKSEFAAKYEVTTRGGGKYLQYFYTKNAHKIPTFLANVAKRGGVAARIDTGAVAPSVVATPPPRPLPPLIVGEMEGILQGRSLPEQTKTSVATIEESKIQHQSDVRYSYVRLGDKLRSIDPVGWKQATTLRELGAKLDALRAESEGLRLHIVRRQQRGAKTSDLKEDLGKRAQLEGDITALTASRNKLLAEFNKRPLSGKLARFAQVADYERALKEAGEKWIAENPEEWKRYLKRHRRKTLALEKKGKTGYAALEFPPHIQEQLNALKWKKRGLSGEAHYIETKAPKLGVGEYLVVPRSHELEGITPEQGAVSYILTAGTWSTKDARGKNVFTIGSSAALYKEFAGVISNIVRGRSFKPGWSRVFDVKDLAEDLHSHLKVKLLSEIGPEYTAQMAEANRARGKNFRSFAISKLNSEAKHFVRDRLQEAVHAGKMEKEVLNEPSLHWSEEGAVTRDVLRQAGAPLAAPYASPEDVIAVKQLKQLILSKVGKMESLGLFSRLNLLNPVDDPKGDGGLKSWDEVAADVVTAMKERGDEGVPSLHFVKQYLIRTMPRLLGVAPSKERPAHKQGFAAWTNPLTPSEKQGLKEGLRSLLRIVGSRQVSVAGTSGWRVARPVTPAGHGRPAKPGLSIPLILHSDIHRVVSELEPATIKQKKRVKKSEDRVDAELAALLLKIRRLAKVD